MPSRPAETGGVAAAAALLIAHFLGLTDSSLVLSLGVVIGLVRADITFIVELVRRRQPASPSSGSASSSSTPGGSTSGGT